MRYGELYYWLFLRDNWKHVKIITGKDHSAVITLDIALIILTMAFSIGIPEYLTGVAVLADIEPVNFWGRFHSRLNNRDGLGPPCFGSRIGHLADLFFAQVRSIGIDPSDEPPQAVFIHFSLDVFFVHGPVDQ